MSIKKTISTTVLALIITSLFGVGTAGARVDTVDPAYTVDTADRGHRESGQNLRAREAKPESAMLGEGENLKARQGRDRVVATVERDGHTIEFVEHAGLNTIGVYETSPLGSTPYLSVMEPDSKDRAPSALELYLAFSHEDSAPAALQRDHRRLSVGAPTPVPFGERYDDGPADGSCTFNEAYGYNSLWAWNWHTNVGQFHDLHNQLSFHDHINGNEGRLFYGNRSSTRTFAACNGSHPHGFPSIYFAPVSYVGGEPVVHHEAQIEPFTQVVYWSTGGPERWDLRMRESICCNVQMIRHWAIGGAVDKPFGFTLGG